MAVMSSRHGQFLSNQSAQLGPACAGPLRAAGSRLLGDPLQDSIEAPFSRTESLKLGYPDSGQWSLFRSSSTEREALPTPRVADRNERRRCFPSPSAGLLGRLFDLF